MKFAPRYDRPTYTLTPEEKAEIDAVLAGREDLPPDEIARRQIGKPAETKPEPERFDAIDALDVPPDHKARLRMSKGTR